MCFVTQQQLTDTWRDGEMRQRRDNYEGQQKNIMKTVHSVYTEPGLQLEVFVCVVWVVLQTQGRTEASVSWNIRGNVKRLNPLLLCDLTNSCTPSKDKLL